MTNSVLFKFENIGWTSWGSVIIGSEKYITQAREVLAGDLLTFHGLLSWSLRRNELCAVKICGIISKMLTAPLFIQEIKYREMWEGTLSQRIRSEEC